MFHIALYQPEIPPNTGNIIRLCANTGSHLHLIGPLGFELEDARLRRAGLDYREWAEVRQYEDWKGFLAQAPKSRLWAFSTRGARSYASVRYADGDTLLFGPETRGLPRDLLGRLTRDTVLRVPMVPGSRSLNLSNTVALVVYEAWRQLGFSGGA